MLRLYYVLCSIIFWPQYLQSFIHYGPSEYSSYCSERLRRTLANGERSEPPCWVELQVGNPSKKIKNTPFILKMTSPSFLQVCGEQEAHYSSCESDGRQKHHPHFGFSQNFCRDVQFDYPENKPAGLLRLLPVCCNV